MKLRNIIEFELNRPICLLFISYVSVFFRLSVSDNRYHFPIRQPHQIYQVAYLGLVISCCRNCKRHILFVCLFNLAIHVCGGTERLRTG